MARHIFVSYAHQDSRFVGKLARYLHSRGAPVWLDQWRLAHNADWDTAIDRAIRSCGCVVVVLSPAAVDSWVVRGQFILARQAGKPVLPVLKQPCSLPQELQDIPHIDLSGRNFQAGREQLLAKLTGTKMPAAPLPARDWAGLLQTGWDRLLPLLWPGWLGPVLLAGVLVAASYLVWPGSANGPAAMERLSLARPTATPLPLPTPVDITVRPRDGKVMVFVPAGEFLMGSASSDPQASDDEKPRHPVFLDAFWIDKLEVSNIQYRLCVKAGHCTPPRSQGSRFAADHQPVVGVNWQQALAYCRWAGGRLPTEAEWEKAARGVDGRTYPWGNTFNGTRLNFCDANCPADWRDTGVDDGYTYTAPVGSYPGGASPYGALDMSGNVWEWTADWYDPGYYHRSAYRNPSGPATGRQRVIRGGSWLYYGKNLRAATRHKDLPGYSYDNIGFRCAVEGAAGRGGSP